MKETKATRGQEKHCGWTFGLVLCTRAEEGIKHEHQIGQSQNKPCFLLFSSISLLSFSSYYFLFVATYSKTRRAKVQHGRLSSGHIVH